MSTDKKPTRSMWVPVFVSDADAFMAAVEKLRRQGRGKTLSRVVQDAVIAQAGTTTRRDTDQDALDDIRVFRVVSQRGPVTEREVFNFVNWNVMPRERVAASLVRLVGMGQIEALPTNKTVRYRAAGTGATKE